MNTAYKHLEAKLRIGEFTLGQWSGLFVGLLLAIGWGLYLSPFGASISLFTACYIGGLPAAAIFLAATTDVDVVLIVRCALRWHREEGRYLPGAGGETSGYVLHDDAPAPHAAPGGGRLEDLDLTALWES